MSLTPNAKGVVLDVGANVGMFSTRAAEALGEEVSVNSLQGQQQHEATNTTADPQAIIMLSRQHAGTHPYPTFFFVAGAYQALVIAVEPWQRAISCLEHNIQCHKEWCAQIGVSCAGIKVVRSGVDDGSTDSSSFTFYPHASGWGTCSKYEAPMTIARDLQAFILQSMQTTEEQGGMLLSPALKQLAVLLQTMSPKLFSFSVHMAVNYLMRDGVVEQCPMCTVSDIIDQHGVETVTLLKIDVERSELDVLSGIKQKHWDKICQVAMECHEENVKPACQILHEANFANVAITQTSDLQGSGIFMIYCSK